MNKRWIAKGALLCACAVLVSGLSGVAEERRLGDYVYVPARQVQSVAGAISLRVEGLALGADSDAPTTIDSLAGAEFGVYVFSGSGELTPWANPLYPSEQMRIRTGEGETRFTLPQGAEYYLRQESAPQGYLFDDETLIPVTGEEIVVHNAMAGQLVISAVDSLGNPLAGVSVEAVGDDGSRHELVTDENGQAVIVSDQAQGYAVAERALPEGVFAALSVSGGQSHEQGVYASVMPANRTRVTFEHPASGSVLLNMQLSVIDDNAQISAVPLAGVRLDVLSEPPVSVVTDDQGQARASLLEGTYTVRLSYEGEREAILPLSEGQMIIESGSTTVIELSATEPTGRIVLMADCEEDVAGGSATLISETTGKVYGPYTLDAEGMAVSEPLPVDVYRIGELQVHESVQLGSVSSGEAAAQAIGDLPLSVYGGQITQADLKLLTRESQMFALVSQSLDEQGVLVQHAVDGKITLTLMDENGLPIAQMDSAQGFVTVEALSGTYALRMEEHDAVRLGMQPISESFALPSSGETIAFTSDRTRLILSSVDESGQIAVGAVYQLTDSAGARFEVECDEDGMAVSPLLTPGEVTIETLDAPYGHDAADAMIVQAVSGNAEHVEILHESYGGVQLSVRMQSLNESGEAVYTPVSDVAVHLYRVEQNGQLTDVGAEIVTDDEGNADLALEAGEYAAVLDDTALAAGRRAPEAVRFTVMNTQRVNAELICLDTLGGVRAGLTGGTVTNEELAQIRFEIEDADGSVTALALYDGTFYAGGLAAGDYVLRQTQIPQGYTLASERIVRISGGEVSAIDIPLEEYAVVSVSKTGLTFDNTLKTYIVPLSGQYGVYTLEDGVMKPYPSAEKQITLWANVTPQEIAEGKADRAKLPAAVEGTAYYLHELSAAPGFAADEAYYEVVLRAGEETTLDCAVSSDRGFFKLDAIDVASGAHISGGAFELVDSVSGEIALAFEMGETAYQNPMAVPVGTYVLRQTKAAPGYALSMPAELGVTVEPYLTDGGTIAHAQMSAVQLPQGADLALIEDIYTAAEQGLTLVCIDTGALSMGEVLHAPELTIHVGAAGSERSDIASVVITGAGDNQGGQYKARVEYCLDGGGWQPSDARMTQTLTGPTAISLDDVQDDISAIRITYIDSVTGMEMVSSGFTPGQISLNVEASAQGEVNMRAQAVFSGQFAYQTEYDGKMLYADRTAQMEESFSMLADGLFETVSAGRDGRITGVAFFDEDADGVMDADETGRYAGLNVSLQTLSGDVVDSVRTGSDGSYAFDSISSGEYFVQFDAGESVVFSRGGHYSSHAVSGIEDMRYGASGMLTIDGDHTDYVVHAGCIFASEISGVVLESAEGNQLVGYSGLSIEMRAVNASEDDEPFVVTTGGMGEFSFSRMLPGLYEIVLDIPQGYLCREAQDGRIVKKVELGAGETVSFGELLIEKSSAIYGAVRVDDNGDGLIDEDAAELENVRVALLRASDGTHTELIEETVTDESGEYGFENLYPGDYSVLFELEGEWAFTRYGEDSGVYGAVSQSGSTQMFTLEPGQILMDVDAGVTIPVELTVLVFKDTQQYDGQKGRYEELLSGVTVSLIRLENGVDAEEVAYITDETGSVVFDGVSPGEYVLAYQMPGQWRATKQVNPDTTNYPVSCVPQSMVSSGRSMPFSLGMGSRETKLYIGAVLSGAVSGTVYYDDDADAKLDEGEAFCQDVTVELLDSSDEVVNRATVDGNGAYLFEGLAPGRYAVRFTAQEGCGFSGTERTVARGGVQSSDSNVSLTRLITVSGGQTASSADAGVVRLGSISGVIWEDRDADTMASGAEKLMTGLSVHLMDGAGRNILYTAQTDEQGRYMFAHLKPGTYKIRMDVPDGYVFSGAQAGSLLTLENERDGRGYSRAFTLLGGAHVQDAGFGLLTQGSISGFVWEDADFDGVMSNQEAGLRGATITLLDADGNEIASRQTIRSGEFLFDRLMPGAYAVQVVPGDGYFFTANGAQSLAPYDARNSAVIALGTLEMGGSIENVNIGALKGATVGGVIWMDTDDDGRRQNEDQGVSGVRAVLEVTSGANAGRTYETTSDETGTYSFTGVMPGDMMLTFELDTGYAFAKKVSGTRRVSSVPMADALTAASDEFRITAGEKRTDLDVGVVGVGTVSGMIWEDSDYDGRFDADEMGIAGAVVELTETATGRARVSAESDENGEYEIGFARKGEYTLSVTLPDGRIFTRSGDSQIADADMNKAETAVFALAMGESVEKLHIGAIQPAMLSGRVVIDENEDGVCGDNESGLDGAVVTAMQGGTVVATVYADETGSFAFDALRPGTYRLRYMLNEDTLFAQNVQLNMTNADALEAETGEYTLVMGQREKAAPVAVVNAGKISGRTFMDENVSGTMDEGEAVMRGVTAELLNADGLVLETAVIAPDGSYAFERLRSGTYSIRFALHQDVLFTDYTGNAGDSCVPVVDGHTGVTDAFALAMGEQKLDMNVGGILPGEIGDMVWYDKDGNGLQDYKEPLIPGVSLTLMRVSADGNMEEAAQTVSDKYGYYVFDALRPGTYVLRLDAQEGDTLTFSFGEPLGEIDSDLDPDIGMSAPISLRSGQTLRNIDVGLTEHEE